MTDLFEDYARSRIAAALDGQVPGASALGAVEYVLGLLSALDHEPPHLWAGPGGWAGPDAPAWIDLGPWERHAWRERLASLRAVYERVVDGEPEPDDARVLHAHACEATYGDPAYGGNRDGAGWRRIGFPEPLFPPARAGER